VAVSTTSLADAEHRLSGLVTSAGATHERTVVTKSGRPAAVLMSADDLEPLEEILALLSDREALVDLAESEVTARHGLSRTSDETGDGTHACSAEESERRLVARTGRAGRADLLASPGAAVRERAAEYA
jgi:antitoxin YefM